MPKHYSRPTCLGCQGTHGVSTGVIRWYEKRRQTEWRVVLCHTCQGALEDLILASSTSRTSGLFEPPTTLTPVSSPKRLQ